MVAVGSTMRLPGDPREWQVVRRLGAGGQGDVYELRADDSERLALKWYNPIAATPKQSAAIREVIRLGAPGSMFLWPRAFVQTASDSFGYTMPLRPQGYRPLSDLLRGRTDSSPSLVLALCAELATAFLLLHAEGLCYRDISFGNIFFDPETGAALICDNDNVGIDGDSNSGVLGTGGFMAPEVVRGEARPSAETDRHSLAVLIFYLTMVHHPLMGRRELDFTATEARAELLGARPVFIFDPADDSNRPDPLTQPAPGARWPRYPDRLRALFVRAFTVGLHEPDRRVRESEWRGVLVRLRDHIVLCTRCGEETLTDDGRADSCAGCLRPLPPSVLLRGPHGSLVLNEGTTLARCHVELERTFDLRTALGRVVHDPRRDLWGIRNDSTLEWTISVPGRTTAPVPPGRTAAIIRGSVLRIGDSEFTVHAEPA